MKPVILSSSKAHGATQQEMTLPLCRALPVLDHSPAHLAQMRGLWSAQSVCEMQACH